MLVPETTPYFNNDAVLWQHNVGLARQASNVQSVTKAARMQITSHNHFRPRICPANAGHHPASCRSIYDIGHLVRYDASLSSI